MVGPEERRGIRVVVIGGGVGGLCLAQGLRKAGVHVEVYEQDAGVRGRNQGYRLHISPEGERALRDCLPEPVQGLLVATANSRYGFGMACYDEQLNPEWAPEFEDPRADSPDKVDAVDRVTLRHVLLTGLDDVVRFGKRFTHVSRPGSGVVAHFADGGRAEADVLVAADGANSLLRGQCGITSEPRDLGVRTIFGRIPMNGVLRRALPGILQDRFTWVIGSDGHKLGLMPMVFRTRPCDASARFRIGPALDDAGDYFMAVFSMHRTVLDMPDAEFLAMDSARLWEFVRRRTSAWHPLLRAVLRYADVPETFPVVVRATVPIEPWPPDAVVPLGDAVHAMPPSGGVGANTAVRDAAVLTGALLAVDRGEQTIAEASRTYQEQMVSYATQAVAQSLQIAKWSLRTIDFDETALSATPRATPVTPGRP